VKSVFAIPASHPAFAGHFPGQPIVPAVVLLAEVLAAVQHATGLAADAWTLASAKFLSPVGPDSALELVHEESANGGRRFEIRAGATLVASGAFTRKGA
jgi:3-hydroxymyristoyl/3-hydroxydecanoyl-(acyl carrier protein) dehydratase